MSKARDLANAGTALTTVSATELGYLDGVTSAVQTQIDSKIGSASAINPTIVDAKGDIIAATAADTVSRLAVGSNDTVLTADSSTATGLKWATPVSGSMTLLSTTATTSGNTITISNISQSYTNLVIVGQGINRAGTASLRITPADASNDFAVYGTNISGSNISEIYPYTDIYPDGNVGSVGNDQPLQFVMTIYNYAGTTYRKQYNLVGGYFNTTANRRLGWSNFGYIWTQNGISKMKFYSDYAFNAGQILVYGVN